MTYTGAYGVIVGVRAGNERKTRKAYEHITTYGSQAVSLVSLLLRAFAHESLGTTHNLDTLLWTPGHIKVHVTFGERLVLGRTSANAAMPVISLARGPLAISVV